MLTGLALKIASPILIGMAVPFVLDALKRASKVIDSLPPFAKQGMAIGIASLVTALSAYLGTDLPTDLASWDAEGAKALVAGVLAIAIKQHRQLKANRTTPHAL